MRPFIICLLSLFALSGIVETVHSETQICRPSPKREVRAVWLTTIGGLDWPKGYARSSYGITRQKEQLTQLLDRLQADGINTILLQTRIRATVIYPSDIEPWDGCLSGRPGVSPGYDALQFAVDECHKRGMELHAWIVCMPICSKALARQLGSKALPRRHPGLCRSTGDGWMLDPGVPETARYLASICREIVQKYDVDGINLDYIRYPEKEISFNDNATYRRYGQGREKASWRRSNITRCVREIHRAVKELKPWVRVSASPVGKHADLTSYSSYGWNAYGTVYQEAQEWMRKGLVDMLLPMMYFRGNHFYPFAYDWKLSDEKRILVPGLGIYFLDHREKDWNLDVIARELNFTRTISCGGQAFFRSSFLTANTKGVEDYLRTFFYAVPKALTPALTWEDSIAPSAPTQPRWDMKNGNIRLEWNEAYDPTPGDSALRYNIYRSRSWPVDTDNAQCLICVRHKGTSFSLFDPISAFSPTWYAVRAVDRYGNEGPAAIFGATPEMSSGIVSTHEKERIKIPPMPLRPIEVCDGEGRILFRITSADTVADISALTPGLYRMRMPGRKKNTYHALGFFLKEP